MGVYSVWVLSLTFAVLQMCVCVECGHTCEDIATPCCFYGTTGMWRTTFGCQKWAPGPVLVAKFGLARTTVGNGGPFLTTKSGEGGHF